MTVHQPLIANWGGGVNSTALIIELLNRGIRPDLIIFADTMGEKPATYAYKTVFEAWLRGKGLELVTVTAAGHVTATGKEYVSLEGECLSSGTMPSRVYGRAGCSDKWKQVPMKHYENEWQPAVACWAGGLKVRKALGIDAGELHRSRPESDNKYEYLYPLIDWDWARDECVAAIMREGLPVPPKSACFFCPSSKPHEIKALGREHPDLLERAIEMERRARDREIPVEMIKDRYPLEYEHAVSVGMTHVPGLWSVRGLGRDWSWETLMKAEEAQLKLFAPVIETPCLCADGEDDEAA